MAGLASPTSAEPGDAPGQIQRVDGAPVTPGADEIGRIVEEFPSDFSYSKFTESGDIVVAFAGSEPEGAREILESSGLGVTIVTDTGFIESDLEAPVLALGQEAYRSLGLANDVEARPDLQSFIVTVYDEDLDSTRLDEVERTLDAATTQRSSSPVAGFRVDVQTSEGDIEPTSWDRAGGTWLVNANSGNGFCTSSFVAKRVNSAPVGVLTAGHCQTSPTFPVKYYKPFGSHESYNLEFFSSTFASVGDAAFFRSPRMMDAWYHYDYSSGAPVRLVRDPVRDETVCRFGRVSETYSCGKVLATHTSWTRRNSDGTSTTIGGVFSVNTFSRKGDSGGPVFTSGSVGQNAVALGLNSAGRFVSNTDVPVYGDGARMWATRIKHAESLTGTRVCTAPGC
ncbi:hypothetical protein GCM10025875_16110 [Litorihabitans aurantiacus]|uniref:Serine protease n=2 Tax=Litorihabitans aurantiacus TaxID=1930061 RepID=A0AA37XEF0_9MICO|nr:hypothetical protein GCM10025875_16110 [Litorihabitans aurantiacus]